MSGSGDSFYELGEPFEPKLKSNQDFAAEYGKRSRYKGKAEELYIHVLHELNKSVKEGNVDSFKKFGDFIDYISTIEDLETLTNYFSNSNNPIKNTNLAILSCKYNSLKILEYLFGSVSKVLQNLTVGVGNKPILPHDEDEMRHNASYYAVRSGNVELLDILINKWPFNYFLTNKVELNDIVSNAYQELLVKGVPITEDMTIYVENELTNIWFYSAMYNEEQNMQNSLNCIKERVVLLCDSVNELKMGHLENKSTGTHSKFLFLIKFITQNIYILKHQLRSTYDSLPWEEIEFCLTSYLLVQVKQISSRFFDGIILTTSQIVNFLEKFTERLSYETDRLEPTEKLTCLPNIKRQQVVADIIAKYPDFVELYNAFEKHRNVHSIIKIHKNLKLALSANPKVRLGQLIIIRVLSNVSELLKCTLDSPNLSAPFGEFLLYLIPIKTRSVLIDLSDSLSLLDSFSKRIEIDRKADGQFFIDIQNDLKNIDNFIDTVVKCNFKFTMVKILLQSIAETGMDAASLVELPDLKERNFLELLIKEFSECVPNPTNVELELMAQIEEKLTITKSRSNIPEIYETDVYSSLKSLGSARSCNYKYQDENGLYEKEITALKLKSSIFVQEHHYRSQDLKEILVDCVKLFQIMSGRERSDDRKRIICEIVFFGVFVLGDWKWAPEIRERLYELKPLLSKKLQRQCTHDLKGKYEKLLTVKKGELKTILSENCYTDDNIANIKIYKMKKDVVSAIEMLLLDILSIINVSKLDFKNDDSFLDNSIPLLIGKALLHYLAQENDLFEILLTDPSIPVILNAKKIMSKLNVKNMKESSKSRAVAFSSLKMRFSRNLVHLALQEQMFAALEEGNLEKLKAVMMEGADINAKDAKSWSSLHFASKGANLAVVKFVLEQKVDVNSEDFQGQRPIHVAAANGRKNIVEFFIEKGVYVDEMGQSNKTPLHFAAENGHLDTLKALLDYNADPKVKCEVGFSPLHYAICNNFLDMAKLLLQKEVDVDINETGAGQTCLHVAASNGRLEILQYLLSNGANVDVRDLAGYTPLSMASENGHLNVVKALILNGADVNYRKEAYASLLHLATNSNYRNITDVMINGQADINPLFVAVCNGHEEIVQVLLENKANGYVTDNKGNTALHIALINGHSNIAELLIKYRVDTYCKNDAGVLTPLQIATLKGNKKLVELLIKNGANVNARLQHNYTPLHVAAESGSKEVIEILVKNKAQLDARSYDGITPLFLAAYFGHESAAEFLIKCKADVNVRDKRGNPILYPAILGGCKEIVANLLKNGANVTVKGRFDTTPLHLAVLGCKLDIVEVLVGNPNAKFDIINNLPCPLQLAVLLNHKEIVKTLIKNAVKVKADCKAALRLAVRHGLSDVVEILLQDTNTMNPDILGNVTSLHMAAKNGHIELVNMLLSRGASVNEEDLNKSTPLYYAAEEGHDEVAKILISNGANVNTTSTEMTPLHIASYQGHGVIVYILIQNGANVDLKDRLGRTALEVGVTRNNFEVVQILLKSQDVDKKGNVNESSTILHVASRANSLKMIEYLVDEGCDINVKNESSSKPIHIAAKKGNIDIVKFFLKQGLGVNEPGEANKTLLHLATLNSHTELVKFLLQEGADIDAKDDIGNTPMHFAAISDTITTVKVLLGSGATFNAANKFCRTPIDIAKNLNIKQLLTQTQNLFEAAKHNNWSEVEKLIVAGAVVNAKKVGGGAPLHFAAWKGYDKVANILLKNEGNPNVVDNKGLTPLHYAAKFSHLKIVKMLLAHGAVYNTVSSTGKTPSELTTDREVNNLLNFIAKSFQNVAENRVDIVADLNKITDTATIRAVMCARNVEQKTLLLVADQYNFSKVEELMAVVQDVFKINLASLAFYGGDHIAAISLNSAILEERQQLLGPNNPATFVIETRIAHSLSKLGKHEEALNMYENIYDKQTATFGLNHKNTLRARCLIAEKLLLLKRYEAALPIFEDIYQKMKQRVGLEFDRSDVFLIQYYICQTLMGLGNLDIAIILFKSLYSKGSEVVGLPNSLHIKLQSGVAEVLVLKGKYGESLKVLNEVLEKQRTLADEHDTLESLSTIALAKFKQNKRQEALRDFQKVWVAQKQALGEKHVHTLQSQAQIGEVFLALGQFISALEVLGESLMLLIATFGVNHVIVAATYKQIMLIKLRYRLQGDDHTEMLRQLYSDLNVAAGNGNVKTVQRLLEGGIDVNKKDVDGRTPLHFAVSSGHIHVVETLLRSSANVVAVTSKGNTPIHTAASKGYKDIVEILLKNVPSDKLHEFVDAKTTATGTTALHVAAKNGYVAIAKCLLENGATYNIKNKVGKTPIDLSENKEISNLLNVIEELFKYAKRGGSEVINNLRQVKPCDLKAVGGACSYNEGTTLLQLMKGNCYEKQLLAMLQLPK